MSNAMEQTRAMVDEVCGKENPFSECPKEISESDFETASEDEEKDEKEIIRESRR